MLLGGFGSSIATTLWDRRSSVHHAQLTEAANVYNPLFDQSTQNIGALGAGPEQSQRLLDLTISNQAGMLGVNDIFWASSILFLILIGFVWLSRPVRSAAVVDAGGAH
jgi:DHA2 family multidrug resistance protein